MGMIGGLIGSAGGAGGTGFAGPQGTHINSPVTGAQANDAYAWANRGLNNQNDFLKALQQQHGLQNQSDVYNQLSAMAQGQGPNPAQAMLANATGQNISSQAALMAGQRGAGANAGLLARQAAMQGGNLQQQAAGQGAAMQAQQSANAINSMGGIAGQQVANQQSQTNANSQSAQNEQANLLNSIAGVNSANVGMQSNVNNANSQMAGVRLQGQQNILGNMMSSMGSMFQMAEGGEVPTPVVPVQQIQTPTDLGSSHIDPIKDYFKKDDKKGGSGGGIMSVAKLAAVAAEGGPVSNLPMKETSKGPQSFVGQHFACGGKAMQSPHMMADGGRVPAMVSPGEQYIAPKDVKKVEKGANPLNVGERIPGKPKVAGNSYANDTVPKNLEEGGIVIPNSVMQSKNPAKEAQKFVEAILRKNGKHLRKMSK